MMWPNLNRLAETTEFVLGSGSPRRQRLLATTGIKFRCITPHVDETQEKDELPYDYALRLSRRKALDVSPKVEAGSIVLGCDTIVVLGNRILHKPCDEQQAQETLTLLSGREHVVCTALALARQQKILACDRDLSHVFFNRVTEDQIRQYVDTAEPMDKAGAYGIQGMGAFLVDRLQGNLDTVIGLPRVLLERLAGEVLVKL